MTKILLIEGNLAVRENTAEFVELANYEVEIADVSKGMNLGADDYLIKPFE